MRKTMYRPTAACTWHVSVLGTRINWVGFQIGQHASGSTPQHTVSTRTISGMKNCLIQYEKGCSMFYSLNMPVSRRQIMIRIFCKYSRSLGPEGLK